MSSRQNLWAKKVHETIRLALGNRCQSCGAETGLTFDCIIPQGHEHHKKGYQFRATFYRRQLEQGNLGLLCEACHEHKNSHDRYWHEEGLSGLVRAKRHPGKHREDLKRIYRMKTDL